VTKKRASPKPKPGADKGKKKNQPKVKGRIKEKLITKVELELQALNHRRDGASFQEIASTQNCSLSTAYQRVTRQLDNVIRHTRETAEQIVQMMDMRLLRIELDMMAIVRSGTPSEQIRAAMAVIAAEARRATLLGLDAGGRLDVTVHAGQVDIDAQITRLFAEQGLAQPGHPGKIPPPLEITGKVESAPPTNGTAVAHVDLLSGKGNRKNPKRG